MKVQIKVLNQILREFSDSIDISKGGNFKFRCGLQLNNSDLEHFNLYGQPLEAEVIEEDGDHLMVQMSHSDKVIRINKYFVVGTMVIQRFYDELKRHDWYAHFSDSNEPMRKADKNMSMLNDIAMESSDEHRQMLVAFKRHHAVHENKPTIPLRPEWPKKVADDISF